MKSTSHFALLIAVALTAACTPNSDNKSRPASSPPPAPVTNDARPLGDPDAASNAASPPSSGPGQTPTTSSDNGVSAQKIHVLQITALNFLNGGIEPCNVRNRNFSFSTDDKNLEVTICQNSKVKVHAASSEGVVTFHATDLLRSVELDSKYDGDQRFELGKTKRMLRYGAENPYGFTYVMAQEVTGLDPKLLAQWNQLNDRAAGVRAQILTAQQQGLPVTRATREELSDLEAQLEVLREKLKKGN